MRVNERATCCRHNRIERLISLSLHWDDRRRKKMMRAVAVPLLLALLAAVRGQDEAKTPEITLPNGSRLSGHAKYT